MLKVMTVTRFGALWSMAMLNVMTVTRFGAKPCTQNRAHHLLVGLKCLLLWFSNARQSASRRGKKMHFFLRFSAARPSAPKAQSGPQVALVMRNLNLAETKRGR